MRSNHDYAFCQSTENPENRFKYIILGAGCAGLSLAWYLIEEGIEDRILLIDRKDKFSNDRTWCYWNIEPTPFDDLATQGWSSLRLFGESGRAVDINTAGYRYLHLHAEAFYQRILERLRRAPNVTILLSRNIDGWEEHSDRVEVCSGESIFTGEHVFDSVTGPRHNVIRSEIELRQQFYGRTIECERAVFEPDRPILMDFRVKQTDGTHFIYVLPFSKHRALVENTHFCRTSISPERHAAELEDYLNGYLGLSGNDYKIEREERGSILMSDRIISDRPGGRISHIGLVGGAARPSSGYAFLRIQRQARELARDTAKGSLIAGASPSARSKYHIFDSIFLRALNDYPQRTHHFFTELFRRADSGSLIRFLTERSDVFDDLRIILSLFQFPLIVSAFRYLRDLKPPLPERMSDGRQAQLNARDSNGGISAVKLDQESYTSRRLSTVRRRAA